MSLSQIQSRIDAAARAAGRDPAAITLIAVSKLQPPERVVSLLAAGHRSFGENRVQEAQGKWPAWRAQFPGLALHLIGPLQTNKLKPALDLFDVIQTLDREKLARLLGDEVQRRGTCPQLFIQVNTGEEPQKTGVLPGEADAFIAACRGSFGLPIFGLMAIPPESAEPVPHFTLLAAIARRNGLTGLSMGMSNDFEAAIAAGATHVRIGSALFGARPLSG